MTIATRNEVMQNLMAGKGQFLFGKTAIPATTTAGNAAAGHFTMKLLFNALGTTEPGTLVGFPLLAPSDTLALVMHAEGGNATSRFHGFAWAYEIGDLVLSATNDQFTHHAATFPLLRTEYGAASQPISLIPMIYQTTAQTGTAAKFRLRTTAGGAGYTDQDGNSVIGTKITILPSATTTAQSGFVPLLEDADSGIRDIIQIEVSTSGSAGAAKVFGLELIAPAPSIVGQYATLYDALYGGFGLQDIKPAVATSGTVNARLVLLSGSTSNAQEGNFLTVAVRSA